MRHAIFCYQDGKYWLCQVLLLIVFQALLCSGRVFYTSPKRSHQKIWHFQGDNIPQEDKAKMAASAATTTSPLPVLRELGFLPRVRNAPTQTNYSNTNPIFVNITREDHSSLDYQIWKALVAKVLHRNTTSKPQPGVVRHSNKHLSSQLPVPHLERLGFGASNMKKTGHFNGPNSVEDNADSRGHQKNNSFHRQDLQKLVVLGLGSFLGGASVIFCLLLAIYMRKKFWKRKRRTNDPEAREDDPKLTLITNEAPPPICDGLVDTVNEYSTSSYSSTSSGSGETISNSSDNISHSSDNGDVWLAPNQIAMSTLPQTSRRNSCAVLSDALIEDTDSLLPECLMTHNSTDSDLLLCDSVLEFNNHQPPNSKVECTSEDGVIIRTPNFDITLIVPPGAVTSSATLTVKDHPVEDFPQIRNNVGEQILSPVVELIAERVDSFDKALTLKLPYRCLPCGIVCSCEDDPLCNCDDSHLELRYCDIATSKSTCQWRRVQYHSLNRDYTWPECFSPENVHQRRCDDFDNVLANRLAQRNSLVSFKYFNSVCSIETNMPGLYTLVRVPHNKQGHWNRSPPVATPFSDRSCSGTTCSDQPALRMCMTVSAKYYKQDERTFDASSCQLEQIRYTLYVTDNTADCKQKLTAEIQSGGCHQECGFAAIDVIPGATIAVTLESVFDPDWPWEIPYDSPTKKIPWTSFCADFGSGCCVDFRCLPRSDEVAETGPRRTDMLSVFDVEILDTTGQEPDTRSTKIIASSNFNMK